MRRIAIIGALLGVGIVLLRRNMPEMRRRMMAHCEAMCERMPDTCPPKNTKARIEQSLDVRADEAVEPKPAEAVDDAA